MKSSPSTTVPPSLGAVIKAYQLLVEQWSALSTMIRSFPQDGWLVSLEPFSDIPMLSVSLAQPSSQQATEPIDSYSGITYYTLGTPTSSSTATGFQDTSVGAGPPPPAPPTKAAPTKG